METALVTSEIWYGNYNSTQKDNLHELPAGKAVFGIFGIVEEVPVNCRYVGETDNLQQTVKDLFDHPHSEGLAKFMQGAWIPLLQYELLPVASAEERQQKLMEWIHTYQPAINEDGEYPGYYD
jgi:hypothetical protein